MPPKVCSPNRARVTLLTSKLDHITPLLKILQQLPISEQKLRSLWWPTRPYQIWSLSLLCPHLLPLPALLTPLQACCSPCCSFNMSGMHLSVVLVLAVLSPGNGLHGSIMSFISASMSSPQKGLSLSERTDKPLPFLLYFDLSLPSKM